MASFTRGGLVTIQSRDLDCAQSIGDLSSLLSPTSAWATNEQGLALSTPTGAMNSQHEISIHTGGLDLGVLLSQDRASPSTQNDNNASNSFSQDDHIFVDDSGSHSTNGSEGRSRTVSEADLTRVSTVLGVQETSLDDEDDKSLVSQMTTDDWSGYNQQRGREVAQVVIQRVKSRSGSSSLLSSREKKNLPAHTRSSDLEFRSADGARKQCNGGVSTSSSRPKGIIALYVNRLRRKRRAFLEGLFSSKAVAKAAASQHERERKLNMVGSHGSTDTAESCESGQCNEECKLSPKSLYIEDDDEEEIDVGGETRDEEDSYVVRKLSSNHSTDSSVHTAKFPESDKSVTSQEQTPKRSNLGENDCSKGNKNSNAKKMIKRFAPHPTSKAQGDSDASVAGSSATDNSRRHRPSKVVDSILRQFSSEPNSRTLRGTMGMVTRRQQPQRQRQPSPPETIQKASSRDREPEETLAEILKMGKCGEKYLAILRRQQQVAKEQLSQQTHAKLLVTDSNSDDDGSFEGEEPVAATKSCVNNRLSIGRRLRPV